jgi:hypothetical protein
MTDEKNLPEATPKFEWVPPRDGHAIPEIYSNYIITSWTMYDIRARIGQLIPSGQGPRDFVVEERAALTLSWAHAKAVAGLLAKLVGDYERANGEIPALKLPQESLPPTP